MIGMKHVENQGSSVVEKMVEFHGLFGYVRRRVIETLVRGVN